MTGSHEARGSIPLSSTKDIKKSQPCWLAFFYILYLVSERKPGIFSNIKEDKNYNHPSTICRTYGAGRNTLVFRGLKFEPDSEIGKNNSFRSGTI